MNLLLEQPAWAWIALAALPLAVIGARMFAAMSPSRRVVAIATRTALIFAAALLLAGLSSLRRTNAMAVVAVIDVSGSVERFYRPQPDVGDDAASAVRKFLARSAQNRGPEDYLGVVAFDGAAVAIATPGRGATWERSWVTHSVPGTNIGEAIRLARALVPPEASGRIVLFSDGNQTAGDALAAAEAVVGSGLGRSPARIDVVPLTYRLDEEVMVESVDAPPTAPAEATVNVRVVLHSRGPSTGTLYLFNEGERLDLHPAAGETGRRVSLAPGRTVELVEVELGEGRVHRFRAVYEPDPVSDGAGGVRLAGDTITSNNVGESFTITPGRGSALLVDGSHAEPNPNGPLASALRHAGIEVSVVAPDAMPKGILALQAFDMVLLDNVGAFAMNAEDQEQLVAYVRDMGGGLAMIGGPESFGPGGWKGTPVGSILPVLVDLPDRVVSPQTATVLVMDNSGSMRRPVLGSTKTQQQIANEAAALAISSMDKSDMVGLIAFNAEASIVIPLEANTDVPARVARARSISSNGGTDLAAGIEAAIREFERVDASGTKVRTRHAVLMTDGKSQRENELPGLVNRLKEMDVKVSAIAVGDDADTKTLERLAVQGGGTFYYASNPNSLPKVFLKAVRIVRSPLIREAPFEPVTLVSGSPITAGLGAAPALNGMVLTRPRTEPGVTMAMVAPTGEPLLAHWSVGLGQCAAFTSDAENWAGPWLAWSGYERMWSQLVRASSRPPGGREVRAVVQSEGDQIVLRMDAANDDGSPRSGLSVPVTLYAPSGAASETALTQTAPGVYEGRTRADETGSYIALLKPQQGDRRLPPVIVGTTVQEGAEFRALSSNDALLASVARAGHGSVLDISNPAAAALFDRGSIRPAEAVTPLWQVLMVVVLVLFLVDVATRRVAWDRWFSTRFRPVERLAGNRSAAAERSVAGLRAAAATSGESLKASETMALGEQDAANIAAAARDRRRAQKLAGAAPPAIPPSTAGAPVADATSTRAVSEDGQSTGLLAAKRRAAKRFDDEGA